MSVRQILKNISKLRKKKSHNTINKHLITKNIKQKINKIIK